MSDSKGLGWDRERNPSLYDLYALKLPWHGWAGKKTKEEREYIRTEKARQRVSIRVAELPSGILAGG